MYPGTRVVIHTKFSSCMSRSFTLKGGVAGKGHLRRRITVTLAIIKFRTRFLAQIVKDHETNLSVSFLGPRDNFLKSCDKNRSDIYYY